MGDSKCKPFLTDVLKDNYRNIICAKSSNGKSFNPGDAYLNPKNEEINEASDIREVCNKLRNIIPLFLSNFVVTHSTEFSGKVPIIHTGPIIRTVLIF